MDLIRDYFLDAHPNPDRIGCPDEKTLNDLAEDRLPLEHPARLHLASCSECVAEYLGYRGEWKQAQGEPASMVKAASQPAPTPLRPRQSLTLGKWVYALAASVLLIVGGTAIYELNSKPPHGSIEVASSNPRNAAVDLFEATTARGIGNEDDAAPLQQVTLPTAVVRLSVTLPRFSQIGEYRIMVSTDRAGSHVVATGVGVAQETVGKVRVNVTLDLRSAKPGAYFLATVRGSDNGTYYYPLQVER
ncbi:hypothetical protein [Acidipila sp. EB88]|uniref:hypothetical protein n=1 Tax=Acidipila sp. EB88 TaxID=2305226 RepID=UPI000F5FB2A0|nr:hypothetical protein [Acidipila sp. EB88]RRA50376.1 hypothetical protein D1Y84_00590 [Acidipila sp. EB88]